MGFARKDFRMEKLAFELLNIIAQIEEKQLHEDIKKELKSIGKDRLLKRIERYAEVSAAVKLYELIKK
nr:MAG TPA: hypothetical protein [Caudoviricetes sp.]